MDDQNLVVAARPKKQLSTAKILVPVFAITTLLMGLILFVALTNTYTPQWFIDRYTVSNYQPSAEVEDLVENSGMNDDGKFYFYTSRPQVDDREAFNYHCAELLNEISTILGCYDGQTYIFNVTDERISGVKYVTSAHEMLHASYDRLGMLETIRVNNLIKRQLAQTTDEDILELVEIYSQTEPGQEVNELHSIFGTEVRDLIPELEEYYARYFSDRQKVVAENEKYEAVFEQMEQRADELDQKTSALEAEIDQLESSYQAAANQLNRDIDSFNYRAGKYDGFASEASFYAERNVLLGRQNQLTAQYNSINAKINEYNGYIEELQALGHDAETLRANMDSQSEEIN